MAYVHLVSKNVREDDFGDISSVHRSVSSSPTNEVLESLMIHSLFLLVAVEITIYKLIESELPCTREVCNYP